MSDIALYNALTKLGLEPDEAKAAVEDVASVKHTATKADLERMGRVIIMWVVAVGLAVVGLIKYLP